MTATECQIKINELEKECDKLYKEIDDYIFKHGECVDPVIVNTVHRPHIEDLHGQWLSANNSKLKHEKLLKLLTINTEDDNEVADKVDWAAVTEATGKQLKEDDFNGIDQSLSTVGEDDI